MTGETAVRTPIACKCCNAEAPFLGMVDFNKSCEDRRGPRPFPPSDVMVPYHRCPNCGFIFTDYCDDWTPADFTARIYNDEYSKADYDANIVNGVTATISYANGRQLAGHLAGAQHRIRLLDFGAGGNPGNMGQALIDAGFRVTSYEPYFAADATRIEGRFDVIYAIEVFEHCPDVMAMAEFIGDHLTEHGLLYFSTLLHPHPSPDDVLSSWYIAPRNGHISIFSLPAITILFRAVGINIVQSAFGLLGIRNPTGFPNSIFT
jgi:2-polyprenyl-6-hydroxyphenyl methylase/3-demethylubiquinone-9 3-methyltransferase